MRAWGALLAVAGLLLGSWQPAAAAPDVGWVIARLERDQIVRLPGAVTSVDAARLAARDRVVLAPAAGLPDDLTSLWRWARGAGVRLTVVEGWWLAQGNAPVPVEKDALPILLSTGDVTDVVVGAPVPVRKVAPAQLAGVRVSQPRTGVRLVTLPVRPGPLAGYATGLAARYPGDLIVVAHGAWLEFAGPGADRAAYARDATYGQMLAHRETTDLVTAVLDRMVDPRPRPVYAPPKPERTSPLVFAGLGLVVVATGAWLLFRRRRDPALRAARAEAYLRIEELGARLAERDDPVMAERHATARLLFDQARTPKAMIAVRDVAEEGLAIP